MSIRIGIGYDVHRLCTQRKLILCGVEIPYDKGLLGHSDADVAAHAIMDSLLGALALGDIGRLFPDSDEKYSGADSLMLMSLVADRIFGMGYTLSNLDVVIIAQAPRLSPYVEKMRQNIAAVLCTDINNISIKATTEEGLGFTGEGLGISAQAVCLVQSNMR